MALAMMRAAQEQGAEVAVADASGDHGDMDYTGSQGHYRAFGGGYDPQARHGGPPTPLAFTYSPERASREAAAHMQEAKEETERWRRIARGFENERDEAQRKLREAEAECMRTVNEIQWASVQQATEYEDRIKRLEGLLEEERAAHAASVRTHAAMVDKAHVDAEARVLAVERRCREAEAAASARVEEAKIMARTAEKRRDDEVSLTRIREGFRVEDMRKTADARVSEFQKQKAFELQALHENVLQRQRAMEETLFLNGRAKSEAIEDARRHAAALDLDMKELRMAKEVEAAHKEARLDEWVAVQRREAGALASHHGAMLELEKQLHRKTVERTMGRVTRQLKFGDGDAVRPATPTRDFMRRQMGTTGPILSGVGGTIVAD